MVPSIDSIDFAIQSCQQIVHPATMAAVAATESGGNPYAIGVVGARLVRQPRELGEAVATAKSLLAQGFNFSVGAVQVNKAHFQRLGWIDDLSRAFDPCTNVRAGAEILRGCYARAMGAGHASGQGALEAALSCYYSGNFLRGHTDGYVTRVLGHANKAAKTVDRRAPGARAEPQP